MSRITPSKQCRETLESDYHVSRETMGQLQTYVDLLVEWQAKTNLVSNATVSDIWQRHILDSIQCRKILPTASKWLDIGTGAGFPGMVIAIVAKNSVDMQLVESNNKKCAFLRKVIRETGASATVDASRIESVTKQYTDTQVISARALSSLDNIFSMAGSWLLNGAIGLFPKGRDYLLEIEKCRGVWEYDLIKHKSQIEADSVILEVRNLKKIMS